MYRVGKNLLDFQIPLRDTEEGRWSEWIHTKSCLLFLGGTFLIALLAYLDNRDNKRKK